MNDEATVLHKAFYSLGQTPPKSRAAVIKNQIEFVDRLIDEAIEEAELLPGTGKMVVTSLRTAKRRLKMVDPEQVENT